MQSLFHLALNVTDLARARLFYGELLGCSQGRSTQSWVDFDFFGHQLSLHVGTPTPTEATGQVGGINVPMPHFGVLLPLAQWQALADRLVQKPMQWLIEPNIRFAGQVGEQYTMFFLDPFNNAIEVKGFADFDLIYQA